MWLGWNVSPTYLLNPKAEWTLRSLCKQNGWNTSFWAMGCIVERQTPKWMLLLYLAHSHTVAVLLHFVGSKMMACNDKPYRYYDLWQLSWNVSSTSESYGGYAKKADHASRIGVANPSQVTNDKTKSLLDLSILTITIITIKNAAAHSLFRNSCLLLSWGMV